MDPQNPFRSLIPTVEGDVLLVLARTHAPLTGLRLAELAGRGQTQVRSALNELERHGIVHRSRHGQAYSYVLNREHILADAVECIARATSSLEQRIATAIAAWPLQPAVAAVFGSFARRDGDAGSDVDLLLVRPDEVGADVTGWPEQRHSLAAAIEAWAGNSAQILELSESELRTAVRRKEPLVANLGRDAVYVVGDLSEYLKPSRRSVR